MGLSLWRKIDQKAAYLRRNSDLSQIGHGHVIFRLIACPTEEESECEHVVSKTKKAGSRRSWLNHNLRWLSKNRHFTNYGLVVYGCCASFEGPFDTEVEYGPPIIVASWRDGKGLQN